MMSKKPYYVELKAKRSKDNVCSGCVGVDGLNICHEVRTEAKVQGLPDCAEASLVYKVKAVSL